MRNATRLALVGMATVLAAAATPSEAGRPGGGGTTPPADPRIAYEAGGALCVMNADGTNQTVLVPSVGTEPEPDWSPDGEWIVFRRWTTGSSLWKVRKDGSGLAQVYDAGTTGNSSAYSPHWSPKSFADGKARIVFHRGDTSGTAFDLWAIDSDGGNPVQLTSGGRSESSPSWSPDGSRIVAGVAEGVVLPRGLVTFTVNDGTATDGRISLSGETVLVPANDLHQVGYVEWSHTSATVGSETVAAEHVVYDLWDSVRRSVRAVNVTTGAVQTLASSTSYDCRKPCWSPNDGQILYRRSGGKASESGIWVRSTAGTVTESLLVKNGDCPDWRR